MSKFLNEFKQFAMRGNVVDMAVGVIIGAAFGKIVSSLVNDVIMPGIGVLTGGANFSEFKFVIQKAVIDGTTQEVINPEVAITWGAFVQTVVDFIIIAFCIFIAIKVINRFRKKEEEAPAGPSQEELLTEIRDLLKNSSPLLLPKPLSPNRPLNDSLSDRLHGLRKDNSRARCRAGRCG